MNFKKLYLSYAKLLGLDVDFRRDCYLDNHHGLTPCFRYERAELLIESLYSWANDYIAQNAEFFPEFSGFRFTLSIEVEKMRITSFQDFVKGVTYMMDTFYTPKKKGR